MSRIEDKICEAIELIVDKAISDAGYDKTIKATIKNCEDASIGKYTIKYQDSLFYAYSTNTDITYTAGSLVYVLIPGNDMRNDKTILGTVDKLGADYLPQVEADEAYDLVGTNCVSSNDTFNLSSWYEHNVPATNPNQYLRTLYSATRDVNELEIDAVAAELYLKEASALICGATFKTSLDQAQKYQGNYGIIFGLDFYDNATGNVVTKYYTVDVDNMTGEPYNLISGKRQYGIYSIDGNNFKQISSISIFTKDFPNHKSESEILLEDKIDIEISAIELFGANKMQDSELTECGISFYTPAGTFFSAEAATGSSLPITAQVRIKGNIVNAESQNIPFYWFREDLSVTPASQYYNQYGGRGWKCLNDYNILNTGTEETSTLVEWVPMGSTYEVSRNEASARKNRIKCVIVYNGTTYFKELTITNFKKSAELSIKSNLGTQFYYDIGRPTLTCYVNGKEDVSNYTYVWGVEDAYGNLTQLPESIENNSANILAYNQAVADLQQLQQDLNNGIRFANEADQEFKQKQAKIDELSLVQMVVNNKLVNVSVNTISSFAIYKCSVYQEDSYLGTATIRLSNDYQQEGNYSLLITNGAQTYQYDEYGVSPASTSLDKPIIIPSLSFVIYNNLGDELNVDSLTNCTIQWKVPTKNTMLKNIIASVEPVIEGDYEYYNQTTSLAYQIQDSYFTNYKNNDIELVVNYKGMTLTAKTNLTFVKQGEPGTNGTKYICRIVPNSNQTNLPMYPTLTVSDTSPNNGHFNFKFLNGDVQNAYIDSIGSGKPPFAVELYNGGERIFKGTQSGISTNGENVSVNVTWEMLTNKYTSIYTDYSDFAIDENTGIMMYTHEAYDNNVVGANIVKCTISYGNQCTLYATLPIIISRVVSSDYHIYLKDNSGFRYGIYTSDGTLPQYDSSNPFEIEVFKTINQTDELVSMLNGNQGVTSFEWTSDGRIYDYGLEEYVTSNDIQIQNDNKLLANQKRFIPSPIYSGLCVNNTVICSCSAGTIYIPIHLLLNKYGLAELNGWDGNSIQLNEEGGFILAPQMGAGKKELDNSFTGVLMGEVRDPNKESAETGLFGYSSGERSFFLDAETGDAYFRGTISNGNKDSLESTGSGVFIDKDGDFSIGDGSQYIKWIDDELDIQVKSFMISISDSETKDIQDIASEADAAAAAALDVQTRAEQGGFDGADGVGVDHTEIKYVVDSQGAIAPADSANWQSNIPSSISPGQFLWTRTIIYYTDNSDSTFFTVSRQGEDGTPGGQGTAGINTATVYLYQRATTTPDKPLVDLTYTFASASITSGSLGNWNQNIGNLEGTNPIWVTAAVASSNTDRDIISRNEWSTPIKMAQDGQEGQPGQQGTNGLNQATVYIYKRSSVGENAPSQTTYTFADGSFTVPSGWSKTIPASDKNPCYVSSAVAIGNGDTATLIWNTPSILVEDGSDGISPTVAAIEGGVEITDANGNKTYVYNGSNGQSYYTYIRYATDSNGSNMSASPTGKTYIGVYSGTASSAPSSASAYAPWMKYIGSDAETYYAFVKYATNNQGANMQDNPASGYDYVGTYTGTKSAPTAADFHWSKYTGEPGQPATQYYAFVKYATNNQGANMQDSPDATHIYVGTYAGTKSNPTAGDYEWSLYVGSNGVSVTAVKEVYFLTTGAAPAQSTLTNGTAISNNADQTEHWTTVVPTYVTNGKYYKSLQTSLSSGTSPIFSTITLDEGLTTANANAAAAESLAQSANENASNALSKVQAKYANCSTQGSTVTKEATITPTVSNWSLFNGAEIFVKFSHANTATNPTLKVNTTSAKPIKNSDGGDLTSTFYWKDNSLVHFVYDGTNWRMLNIVTTEKYNTLVSNIDGISQTVGTKASQTDLTNLTTRVSTNETNISQTATSITSLVSNQDTYTAPDGTTKTNTIKSAIKQNADNISLRVEKNGVIAAINASTESDGGSAVKISADKVNIEGAAIFTGNGRLSQTSLNNSYDTKGAAATAESNAVSTAAADATSKANAAQSAAITAAAEDATSKADAVNNALEAYKTSTNSTLSSLQNQVDGQVEVWYYNVDPTTSNPPASTWNTDTLKARHEGDLYYNISNGHSWRWLKNGNTYSWQQIPDGDAAAALAKANEAMGLAGDKRRIFTAQPTPPYDVGDLWVNGSEVKYCKTSRASGNYVATDWTLTATDDTKANSAAFEEQYIYISKVSGTLSVGVNETWVSRSDDVQNIWTTKRPTYNSDYPVLFVAKQKKTVSQSSGTSCSCSTPIKDDTTTVIDGGHITTGTIDARRLNVNDIIARGNIIVQGDDISDLNNDSGFQTSSDVSSSISSAINNLEIGGRNLFITSTAVNGYLASNGTSISSMNATNKEQTSAFIPVIAGEKYILQCWVPSISSNSSCWLGYAFYTDTNLSNVIGTRTAKNGTNGVPYLAYTSITAPDTANYIRVSFRRFTDGYAKLEQGTLATDWTIAYEDTIAQEQRIYYRSKVSTKPNGNGLPTSWVTETGNKYNANATTSDGWSRKVTPISSSPSSTDKYLYLWTCVQKQTVSGVVTYSDILLDDSTTVIDGGNIITGTVLANAVNASSGTFDTANIPDLNASKITAGDISADRMTVNSIQAVNNNTGTLKISASKVEIDGAAIFSNADFQDALADEIPTKVSDLTNDSSFATTTQVDTAISNIEVGGRNYMINTGSPTTANPPKLLNTTYGAVQGGTVTYNNGVATYTTSSTSGEHHIRFTNVNNSNNAILANGLDTPGSLVFSGECFPTMANSSSYWTVRVQVQINSSTSWSNNMVLTNLETGEQATGVNNIRIAESQTDYKKFAVRIDIPANVTSFYLSFQQYGTFTVGDTFLYKNLKLEKGNRATDWTPAPEDALGKSVPIYTRTNSNTVPTVLPTVIVTNTSDTGTTEPATNGNGWTKMHMARICSSNVEYKYLWTCNQLISAGGSLLGHTDVVADNGTTVINGDEITTGTISADRLNIAGTITAINNDSSTTINGGKITTGSITIGKIDQKVYSYNNSGRGTGYAKLFTIAHTQSYKNSPISFTLYNRGKKETKVTFNYANNGTATSAVVQNATYDGGTALYYVSKGNAVYDVYFALAESYDTIYITDYINPYSEVGLEVTWSGEYYGTSLPEGAVEFTKLVGSRTSSDLDNAAKTATNYLTYDSNTGSLMIADMTNGVETPSTATGRNVLIDSYSVDIRDGSTSLACFGDQIRLGDEEDKRLLLNENGLTLINAAQDEVFEVSQDQGVTNRPIYVYKSTTINLPLSSSATRKVNFYLPYNPKDAGNIIIRESFYYNNGANGTISRTIIYDETSGTTSVQTMTPSGMSSDLTSRWEINRTYNPIDGTYCDITLNIPINSGASTLTYACRIYYDSEDLPVTSIMFGSRSDKEDVGDLSFTSGLMCSASGNQSFASGMYTTASGDNQMVIGRYNIADSQKAFIIGGGNSNNQITETNNILTVDWDGNVKAAGEVKQSVTSTTITSFSSPFKRYGDAVDNNIVTLRRIGNLVMLSGVVSTTASVTSSATEQTMFTIPDGYRPLQRVEQLSQGSTVCRWLLTVNTNGTVCCSRYATGNSASYSDFPSGVWLPLHAVWITV